MIPGDDARGREAQDDALGSLLEHAGPRLWRELGARVAGHQPQTELAHARGVALTALTVTALVGLALAYVFPTLPPSSMIIAAAVGVYALVLAATLRDPRTGWFRLASGNVA